MSPAKSPQKPSAREIGKKDKLVAEKVLKEELPPGWKFELRIRKGTNGKKKDRYYTDPDTGYIFRSFIDVQRYLKTGEIGRLAKKPKPAETEEITASSPLSETPSNKRPLEDNNNNNNNKNKSSETKKSSELPERASKRLAGATIDPPPLPPPSPPKPKSRKATRSSSIKTDTPPPPPPPPTAASPPEPKTSPQVTMTHEKEAQNRPPIVLGIPKEKVKQKNDGNADVAAKVECVKKVVSNKDKAKADEKQKSHPVNNNPIHEEKPPTEIPVKNPTQESSLNYCLNDFWTDPCIEFAVKTLTGAIPFGELDNKVVDNSPVEVPMEELWTDPCIEFAVKTLTGAIPVGDDLHFQPRSDMGMSFYQTGNNSSNSNNNNKQMDSSGLQKSGGIGFHQQVSGSNGRPSLF